MERIIANRETEIMGFSLFIIVLISIGLAFYNLVVLKNYKITSYVECNPNSESCFVHICDPELGEECTGNTLEDTFYYKIASMRANDIDICNEQNNNCKNSFCDKKDIQCEFIYCDTLIEDMCLR